MKKYLLLAVFLLPVFASSQIDAAKKSVRIVGYWDKNEKQAFEIITKNCKVSKNDTLIIENVRCKADIIVIDSTSGSYTFEWRYHDIQVETGNDLSKKIAALNEGLTLRYTTDEFGVFLQLLNWKDIIKHNESAIALLEKAPDAERHQKILAFLKSRYVTREAIESHSMKDVQLFHAFHGIEISEDQVLENSIEEPSPYGGKNIKSYGIVELSDIETENATYIVKFWQDFESESVNEMIHKTLKAMKEPDLKKDIKKKDINLLNISLKDYTGTMMHESGWPLNIYYERVVGAEDEDGILEKIETKSIIIE